MSRKISRVTGSLIGVYQRSLWLRGPVGLWVSGSLGPWASLSFWVYRSLGLLVTGSLDLWVSWSRFGLPNSRAFHANDFRKILFFGKEQPIDMITVTSNFIKS